MTDHATSISVLAALRPTGPDSALLVVTQGQLPGQVGDHLIEIAPLDARSGTALLARATGPERIRADPEAAALLVALCDGLPLAIRGVGRWLACKPHYSLARAAQELQAAPSRISGLWWAGRSLEDSVLRRLRDLPAGGLDVVEALRHSTRPEAAISPTTVARRLGWSTERAGRLLDALAVAQLVVESTDSGLTEAGSCTLRFWMRPTVLHGFGHALVTAG